MELLDHKAKRGGLTEVDPTGQNTWSASDAAIGDRGGSTRLCSCHPRLKRRKRWDKRRITIFTYLCTFILFL